MIITIAGIVAITENIRSLWSSQLRKFDFHIVAGIVQIAGTYDRCDHHDRCDRCVLVSIWSLGSLQSLRSLQLLHWWFPLTFCYQWRSFTIATIAEIDTDSIPAIVIVAIVGSRWDRWRSLAKWKFGFHIIVTIAEHFTSDPSDCEWYGNQA